MFILWIILGFFIGCGTCAIFEYLCRDKTKDNDHICVNCNSRRGGHYGDSLTCPLDPRKTFYRPMNAEQFTEWKYGV